MRKQTRGMQAQIKYLQFMRHLYNEKSFNRKQVEANYKISTSICTVLAKRGFIVTDGEGLNKWVGKEPSMELVVAVLSDIRLTNRTYVHDARNKPKNQLKLQPIRKAPLPTPMPIVREAECDTSNSKIFLILAVGAVVGFIIATIIWK
jgi:hypothetical protein